MLSDGLLIKAEELVLLAAPIYKEKVNKNKETG